MANRVVGLVVHERDSRKGSTVRDWTVGGLTKGHRENKKHGEAAGVPEQKGEKRAFSPMVIAHLAIQQICVFLTENFLVILEDAVTGPGTHEVEIAEAGGKAAAHRGSRL